MLRFLLILFFALWLQPAAAQNVNTNCGTGQPGINAWGACRGINFVPNGYQQLTTISSATALTVPAGSQLAEICVEAQSVRWRDDGTAPTATVGMPVAAGTCFQYGATTTVGSPLAAIQFILVTSGAIVNVSYYK